MDFILAFLAILAVALFFIIRFKLNASVAPFFAITAVILWLCMTCMLGLVYYAVWAVYLFAVFALVYVFILKKTPLKEVVRQFFTPGMSFFIAVSLLFFFLLMDKQPWFRVWDEFSFWGIAAKGLYVNNQIYTMFESSMINFSYPPALPLISYFVQFFGSAFVDWKLYLAYDMWMMSVMAVLFARLKWKNAGSIVALCGFGVMSLYLFWWTFEGKVLFCDSYADIPIGVLFGGVLAAHFFSEENGWMKYLVALTGVMTLPFVKDIGFALALVAALLISADMIIANRYPAERFLFLKHKVFRLLFPIVLFVGIILSYQLWALHFNLATSLSRAPDPYQYSAIEIFTGKDPYFLSMLELMWKSIFADQIVTFGTIFDMCLVFTLVPIALSILTLDLRRIIRVSFFSLAMLAGFTVYCVFMAYTYTAIFRYRDYELISFPRYASSYVIGWMIAAVGVCVSDVTLPFFKKARYAPAAAVAAALCIAVWFYSPVHADQYVFTSYKVNTGMAGVRERIYRDARQYDGYLDIDDRIFFVCQDSDGGEWFIFNYEMMPAYTIHELSVNIVGPDEQGKQYALAVDRAGFIQLLRDFDVDFIYILKMNDYFFNEFSPLFTDGLMGVYDRTSTLYMVVPDGDSLMVTPVFRGTHIAALREQYHIAE